MSLRSRVYATAVVALLLFLPGLPTSASDDAWVATPGGWVTGEVEYLGTLPLEAATGIDAVLHGNYLYTTTWRSFSIYDVSDPVRPQLLSQTPTPGQLINEIPQTNGELLLLSNDNVNRQLDLYDVTDKMFPELIGSYEDPLANHVWTCVLDCTYAYGGRGSILDLSDPTSPEMVGLWTDAKTPRGYHAIGEIAPGLVMTASDPVLYLDARDDPENPTLLAELKPKITTPGRPYVVIGPAATSLPARVAWPLGGQGGHVLVTMETPFSGECDEQSGTFLSYASEGWEQDGFQLADEYMVADNGLPSDGSAPVNAFGCGAYGLDVNRAFAQNGLAATAWFEHGTRVLRVEDDGELTEVGGFLGHGGTAVRPLWIDREILYVVDVYRGIDILRVREEDRRYRDFPYAIPAGDLDGDGLGDTLTSEAIAGEEIPQVGATGITFRVAARRGASGSLLWERPDKADTLLAARLGPQAAPSALLVDGFRTSTGGGGGASDSGVAERVEYRELDLRAVSGGGALLWQRVFEAGVFGGAAVADSVEGRRQVVVAERFPTFAGLLQATPSAAQDMLVSVLTRRETPDQVESTIAVSVVDGATGAVGASFTVETEGSRSAVHPAGDLDGDGLDDLVVLRDPTTGGLTARRGTNGAVLWTNPADIVPFEVTVDDLGDVTGDGIDELVVRGFGDVFDEAPPRVTVLDGSDGRVLHSATGGTVVAVGELDEDGTIGFLTQREVPGPDRAVSYRLFDATGELRGERSIPVPGDEDASVGLLGAVGDVDGDGVTDAGHRVSTSTEDQVSTETTVVSGRTLAALLQGATGLPLGASIDGGGDDLLAVERATPSELVVTAQDGATGAARWSSALPADDLYTRMGRISVRTLDADGDATPDILLNVETIRLVPGTTGGSSSEHSIDAWVLRGTDGAVLWRA